MAPKYTELIFPSFGSPETMAVGKRSPFSVGVRGDTPDFPLGSQPAISANQKPGIWLRLVGTAEPRFPRAENGDSVSNQYSNGHYLHNSAIIIPHFISTNHKANDPWLIAPFSANGIPATNTGIEAPLL
jgi:hypothetical protein